MDGFESAGILKDLVFQGYEGEEMLAEFAKQRDRIKKAIGFLIDEADEIAAGNIQGATTKEIFEEA